MKVAVEMLEQFVQNLFQEVQLRSRTEMRLLAGTVRCRPIQTVTTVNMLPGNVFQPDDHIATDVDIAGGQTHRMRLTQQEHPETSRIALGRGDARHLQYTAPIVTGRLPSTTTQNRPLPSSRNVNQVLNQRVFSNDARAQ